MRPNYALVAALRGGVGRILRDVELPGMGPAKLRLLGRAEEAEIEIDVARALARRPGAESLDEDAAERLAGVERAPRVLAIAVRSPQDPRIPFGSAAEWMQLPGDVLASAWGEYVDLVADLDPLRGGGVSEDLAATLQSIGPADKVRCRHAAELRAFFEVPACELSDTDVMTWAVAVGLYEYRDANARPTVAPGAFANADDFPDSPPAEEDAPPVEIDLRAPPENIRSKDRR